MQERRQPEIIAGRVNLDGSIAAGDGFTVQKGGVGAWNVFLQPGFRLIAVTTTAYAAGATLTTTTGATGNAFTVAAQTAAGGVATDQAFTFVAVGVQT